MAKKSDKIQPSDKAEITKSLGIMNLTEEAKENNGSNVEVNLAESLGKNVTQIVEPNQRPQLKEDQQLKSNEESRQNPTISVEHFDEMKKTTGSMKNSRGFFQLLGQARQIFGEGIKILEFNQQSEMKQDEGK